MQAQIPQTQNLKLTIEAGVARVTLNRPSVHNAFNPALIEELRSVFAYVGSRPIGEVRVAVLAGEGRSFCAGADINWMHESLSYTEAENVADALRMALMFDTINSCPVPVVARLHGAVLGGGIGLTAVSDIAVAEEGTTFGLSEVKLGIAPAVISPYVIAKIGRGNARALFLTGERFGSARALRIGLIHVVAAAGSLDTEVDRTVGEIMSSGPAGAQRAKYLIDVVPDLPHEEAVQLTAETIANLRVGAEGQEGLQAFLEKRKPGWAP